ncbi:hypothetical protein [Intrasporangium calvum]|uniref:ATP synthase protein I n=1 Tax=Intrasporangium calvum (strain ATCC 23552 / DSM 43043 / JCM 3097 / NBRC 12989 / NCIMB 10167 / NRRL B-3866 / 7 KIP) TaxID=710696 RepID=E6S6F9_INTC7|nr:hypothetical protein [Intrasporangium calvum]ADU48948.1 hypothetical protein Intca_2441 [Intrasporangium calvum DSM 43043]AXG13918.1 hypothetical protein DN585_11345 [Intrasporangium calvum]
MRTSQSRAGAESPVRTMLRTSLAFSAVSVPLIALGAWLLRGPDGAISGLVGAAVAVGFFVVGAQGLRAVIAGEAAFSLAGALVVYLGQLIALVAVLLVLREAEWLDGRAFAASAIVQTLVWQAGQVVGFRRGRHEIYPDVTLPSGS